jgi:hypothetical protein
VDDTGFLQRLRRLIGRDCSFLGQRYRLVEVLTDEGTLVLEARGGTPPIQTDQYGQAAFRAHEILHVSIHGPDPEELSDDLMDLLASLSRGGDEQP